MNYAKFADLNHDGNADIVFYDSGTQEEHTRLGAGNGTFGADIILNTNLGLSGLFEVGDVNGDGKADLVMFNYTNDLVVYLGNGDGSFNSSSAHHYSLADETLRVYLQDVNGDGKLDVVAPDYHAGQVEVLYGIGDGTFQAGTSYSTGANATGATEVGLGDFDGDGLIDMIATNEATANMSIFIQDHLI